MTEIKDLLDEAVGPYRAPEDPGDVERLVERRRRRRRLGTAIVALSVFGLAGWFAWSAFRPMDSTIGSTASGNYILSDLEVSPMKTHRAEDVDPTLANVAFRSVWSSGTYPGDHECGLAVRDASGSEIGSQSFQLGSLVAESRSETEVTVTGSIEGATASGSCDPERLDTPVAYDINDVRLNQDLTVSYVVGWPDGLGPNDYPSQNACTAALVDDDTILARYDFTLGVGDGQEVTTPRFAVGLPGGSGSSTLEPKVVCEPYSQDGVFPDLAPLGETAPPAADQVIVPEVSGLSPDAATAQLENLGLVVSLTHSPSDYASEGLVLSQDPNAGASVDPGTTVTIVVGAGPESSQDALRVTCPPNGPPVVEQAEVNAQPDGLHILVDSRSGADVVIIRQPSRPWVAWSSGSDHLDDEFVRPVPPGETLISCHTEPLHEATDSNTGPQQPDEASFRIADSAGWISTDLSCPFDDAQPFFSDAAMASSAGKEQLVEAVRAAVPGVLPTDQLGLAGYPESTVQSVDVRVVRAGSTVAIVMVWDRGEGAASVSGYACPGTGIG